MFHICCKSDISVNTNQIVLVTKFSVFKYGNKGCLQLLFRNVEASYILFKTEVKLSRNLLLVSHNIFIYYHRDCLKMYFTRRAICCSLLAIKPRLLLNQLLYVSFLLSLCETCAHQKFFPFFYISTPFRHKSLLSLNPKYYPIIFLQNCMFWMILAFKQGSLMKPVPKFSLFILDNSSQLQRICQTVSFFGQ